MKFDPKELLSAPRYIVGDCRKVIPELSIQPACIITSPPYFNVRKYPAQTQMGYGQTIEEFSRDLGGVFGALWKKAKPGATLWLIADSIRQNGQLLHLPAIFVEAVERGGWKLQSTIVWYKDRTYPWLDNGRLRKLHELILLFTKGDSVRLHVDRIREVDSITEWWLRYPERYNPLGKAPSDVWYEPIPVQGSWGKGFLRHECPFPPRLVERLIELSTSEKDLVVDPFAGSGVVAAVADAMGRMGLGIDVSAEFAEHFETDVKSAVTQWWVRREGERAETRRRREVFFKANVALRILKLGRLVGEKIADSGLSVRGCWLKVRSLKRKMPWASVRITLVLGKDETPEAIGRTQALLRKPPLSKFGLNVDVRAVPVSQFRETGKAFLYDAHFNGRKMSPSEFRRTCKEQSRPIVAASVSLKPDDIRGVDTKYWRNRLPPTHLREETLEYLPSVSQGSLWPEAADSN